MAVATYIAPPALYAEEPKSKLFGVIQRAWSKPAEAHAPCMEAPIYLSAVGYSGVMLDHSKLPVLSLSLANPVGDSFTTQDDSFHFEQPSLGVVAASSVMFNGNVALAGDDYDLLCELLDAEALGEVHPLLA